MAAGAAVALSRQGRRGTLSDADAAAPRHRRPLRRRAAAKGGAMSDLFLLRTALPPDTADLARAPDETWADAYDGQVQQVSFARTHVSRDAPHRSRTGGH